MERVGRVGRADHGEQFRPFHTNYGHGQSVDAQRGQLPAVTLHCGTDGCLDFRIESSPHRAAVAALREIDLIREYRTRLIADVVTGKLDVREAAANLSEEVEGPDDWGADENEGVSNEDAEVEVECP